MWPCFWPADKDILGLLTYRVTVRHSERRAALLYVSVRQTPARGAIGNRRLDSITLALLASRTPGLHSGGITPHSRRCCRKISTKQDCLPESSRVRLAGLRPALRRGTLCCGAAVLSARCRGCVRARHLRCLADSPDGSLRSVGHPSLVVPHDRIEIVGQPLAQGFLVEAPQAFHG